MGDGDILILKGHEIRALLEGRETELVQAVRLAYEAHGRGESSLPHSNFLRFPKEDRNRIIALPAFLGDGWEVAGIKWVASFPGNLQLGLERASALVVLNSARTGRPEAILEGSLISARRTAASAALAAKCLHDGRPVARVGVVGCGLISFEITRFLLAVWPELRNFVVFDLDPARAQQFADKVRTLKDGVEIEVAASLKEVLRSAPVISMATTAITPHIDDLSDVAPGSTILHISLRDLTPEVILGCDNVVDDVDHVSRAQTSVHLAEQLVGHRDFVRCNLADILSGRAPARRDADSIAVFSPFGLGILDLAVAKMVLDLGRERGQGTVISSFLPEPWVEKS